MAGMLRKSISLILFVTVAGAGVFAMGEEAKSIKPVIVDVLTLEGCKVTPPTIEQLRTLSKSMNVPIKIHTIYIETKDEAIEKRFFGSPTVRMDGLDIEPRMRGSTSYGIG
jgi:hypothetical protein